MSDLSIYQLDLNEEEKRALTILAQYMVNACQGMREPWMEPGILESTYHSLTKKLVGLEPKIILAGG